MQGLVNILECFYIYKFTSERRRNVTRCGQRCHVEFRVLPATCFGDESLPLRRTLIRKKYHALSDLESVLYERRFG
jgi:hypothetical protein